VVVRARVAPPSCQCLARAVPTRTALLYPRLTRRSGHCRLFDGDDSEDLPKELMKLSLQSKYQVRSSIGFSRMSHSHSPSGQPQLSDENGIPVPGFGSPDTIHNIASERPLIS
jgi:hypothetical protein